MGKFTNIPAINPGSKTPADTSGYVWSSSKKVAESFPDFKNYSFATVFAYALVPFSTRSTSSSLAEVPLKNISLWAASTHVDKYPVAALGISNFLGFTRGHRVIAGTLGFTLIKENPFAPLIMEYATWLGNPHKASKILPDELPPFDLLLVFKDPSTRSGYATIQVHGVSILDSSRNISISDITLSDSYSYMALGITELIDGKGIPSVDYVPSLSVPDITSKRTGVPSTPVLNDTVNSLIGTASLPANTKKVMRVDTYVPKKYPTSSPTSGLNVGLGSTDSLVAVDDTVGIYPDPVYSTPVISLNPFTTILNPQAPGQTLLTNTDGALLGVSISPTPDGVTADVV